ncbi:type I DNA topoisomerase [Deinococcus sonorensis]|uniref:DNA topoisomerase 1 n=2 Tax=Deinococcus sonorensis TaxID=309891 RepID=A0AAU7UAN4_9DEIO
MTTLVLVESPSKARKIAAYLGQGYQVRASLGHVRDLPAKKEDVPARYAKEPWARLGVDVAHGFRPLYVIPKAKAGVVKELRQAAERAGRVILATDGDREGESIAWHLAQLLGLKDPERMVFHEITPDAIRQAVAHTRPLDYRLVGAAETRRVLDRLSGYGASPLLWDAIGPGLSAGRVQSAALALLAQREHARLNFVAAAFWRVTARIGQPTFTAAVTHVNGQALATPKDFGPDGTVNPGVLLMTPEQAEKLVAFLKARPAAVQSVEATPFSTRPPAPFTTSTLQQAASIQLKLAPKQTMDEAQRLYEGGFITYMRTDSPGLSDEATRAARAAAQAAHGPDSVPERPRTYAPKTSTAQEAHEAIRPTGRAFRTPAETGLAGTQADLYDLIYRRTVASQMTDLRGTRTQVTLAVGRVTLGASGRVITDPGFTRAYQDEEPDPDEQALPPIQAGEMHDVRDASAERRTTPAPRRYSEASLVRALERQGVGRPSTFASILSTLATRGYTTVRQRQLVVTWLGLLVTQYLGRSAPDLVDPAFTAKMEADLDRIAEGQLTRLECLTGTWTDSLDPTFRRAPRDAPTLALPKLPGVVVGVRGGQPTLFGDGRLATLPPDLLPEDLTPELAQALLAGERVPARSRRTPKADVPKGKRQRKARGEPHTPRTPRRSKG